MYFVFVCLLLVVFAVLYGYAKIYPRSPAEERAAQYELHGWKKTRIPGVLDGPERWLNPKTGAMSPIYIPVETVKNGVHTTVVRYGTWKFWNVSHRSALACIQAFEVPP